MNARREAGAGLVGCVLGAVLVLLAAGRPWADGQAVQGTLRAPLHISGGSLAPAVPALGLAALAGALAVLATRGFARRLAGVVVLACGAGVVVASAVHLSPDAGDLAGRAGSALGTASATATGGGTAWPWLAILGGLLVTAAGGSAVWHGPRWPSMGGRYEVPGGTATEAPVRERSAEGETALEQWRAMDRGEDPTLG